MDSRHGKIRKNVEGDRLSNLPDDLIHKILSFIGTKQAIKTSVLSSRWRYIWISTPCLSFSSEGFHSLREFSKFITHVLSAQNNQTEVHYVNLAFCGKASHAFVKRILAHAFSHNVQQLNITCLPGKKGFHFNLYETPLSVFTSQSLKNLSLSGYGYKHYISIPPAWYLPALTTLKLICVALNVDNTTDKCAGSFSNCANLKNLTLKNCRLAGGSNHLNICHHGLSSLTLEDCFEVVNVVTPQLKNLTIINWSGIHLVSAPNLASLHYKDDKNNYFANPLKVSSNLLNLEKVDVCIQCSHECKDYAHDIVRLLQRLYGVKFLTLNLELVKLLSSFVELISDQASPFTNLKSLKIYPADITEPEVTMSTEVKNYLLDGSQGATFTLVSYEEVRAVMNVASAQRLMRELQVLLDQWAENSETNTADMQQHMAPMESHIAKDTKMKWQFGEKMTHIESYWEGLKEQLERGYKNTRCAISMLREIEGVLTKLPASHRDKLQGRFSGLCAEAETVMDDMMDHMKIQCDKKPQLLNVSFHELVTERVQ